MCIFLVLVNMPGLYAFLGWIFALVRCNTHFHIKFSLNPTSQLGYCWLSDYPMAISLSIIAIFIGKSASEGSAVDAALSMLACDQRAD